MELDLAPVERKALGYCAPRGIPLSVFLGRVVYPGEPQWTERDTAAALWWMDNICSGCGEDLAVSMDPANERKYQAEGLWCFGCRAIHREGVAMCGKNPHADADPTAGTRYRFTRTPATPVQEVA